jgi:acetoin utilization deacetylase AcuC-like enzyme
MKVFYSEIHRAHHPPFEVFDGGKRVPYLEIPDRVDRILSALSQVGWAERLEPVDFGMAPLAQVHDEAYLEFLAGCWAEWLASDPEAAAAPTEQAFLPATFALRRKARVPAALLGRAGYYMMDLSACIVEATFRAALASANAALSAAQHAAASRENTFAVCRPPGHHAGRDYAAGYCYINNAAVAAHWLSKKGKSAILDIDYHAGNGTQDIFYQRNDVLTLSIHGDPDFEYPHFIGFADERGEGEGLGFHRNFPLPQGTGDREYLAALDRALEAIREFSPSHLVLSAGFDTFEGDPLGKFKITQNGFVEIGRMIASMRIPTAILLEGGYANTDLGLNAIALLENFR